MDIEITPELEMLATKRQLEYLRAYVESKSFSSVAKDFNVNESSVRKSIKSLLYKSRLSSESSLMSPASSMQMQKASVFVRDPDNPDVPFAWYKFSKDAQDSKKILEDLFSVLKTPLPAYTFQEHPKPSTTEHKDNHALYVISDLHIGMAAHSDETDEAWDIEKCIHHAKETITRLIDKSPYCEEGIIAFNGDLLHSDKHIPTTNASGHVLDMSCSFKTTVKECNLLIHYCISQALKKHDKITLLISEGNHDENTMKVIQSMYEYYFRDDDKVHVHQTKGTTNCIIKGECMHVFHHGHKIPLEQLAKRIPILFPTQWGVAKYRYGHVGHLHHTKKKTTSVFTDEMEIK